jgi:hypothetical protein
VGGVGCKSLTAAIVGVAQLLAIALEVGRGWINQTAKESAWDNTENDEEIDMTYKNNSSKNFKFHPLASAIRAGIKTAYDTAISVGASALLTAHRSA